MRAGKVAQVVQHLPSKHEALSSTSVPSKKKKKVKICIICKQPVPSHCSHQGKVQEGAVIELIVPESLEHLQLLSHLRAYHCFHHLVRLFKKKQYFKLFLNVPS
jgi:hypothetical protein